MWKIITDAVPQMIAAGIKYTIPIALVSFAIGLIIALVTALTRISVRKGILIRIAKGIAVFYVWLFRSTPLLVQLFIVFFGLPSLIIPGVFPHGIKLDPVSAGIITFSLNTGAYCAETIRASLLSIDSGQWEAAYAIGLPRRLVLREIIIPQALRTAISITIVEMFQVSQQIAAENYQPLLMYSIVALLYAIVCTFLAWGQRYLEKFTSRYNANAQTTQL